MQMKMDIKTSLVGIKLSLGLDWVSSMKLLSSPKSIFHLDDLNFFQARFLLKIWGRVVKMLAYGHKKLLM